MTVVYTVLVCELSQTPPKASHMTWDLLHFIGPPGQNTEPANKYLQPQGGPGPFCRISGTCYSSQNCWCVQVVTYIDMYTFSCFKMFIVILLHVNEIQLFQLVFNLFLSKSQFLKNEDNDIIYIKHKYPFCLCKKKKSKWFFKLRLEIKF